MVLEFYCKGLRFPSKAFLLHENSYTSTIWRMSSNEDYILHYSCAFPHSYHYISMLANFFCINRRAFYVGLQRSFATSSHHILALTAFWTVRAKEMSSYRKTQLPTNLILRLLPASLINRKISENLTKWHVNYVDHIYAVKVCQVFLATLMEILAKETVVLVSFLDAWLLKTNILSPKHPLNCATKRCAMERNLLLLTTCAIIYLLLFSIKIVMWSHATQKSQKISLHA